MVIKPTEIIVFIVSLTASCESGRILAIMPTPSYSHQIVFNPLWLQLNSRGHHVTLFTTDPIKNSNLSNFRQIDWNFAYKLWHEKHNVSDIINNFNKDLVKCLNQYMEMMSDIIIQELEHPGVKSIINDENEHFDLVIAEFLIPTMIAFSKRFNCPFIGISPMDIPNFVHEALGNPVSPALFPDFMSPFDDQMNFFERVLNTFYYLGGKLYFRYYFYPKMDKIVKTYFGKDYPRLDDMQLNVSTIFLNINPIIHTIKPLTRNILVVGGGTHFMKDVSLPHDIQMFLDEAEVGAIYFSLGTNVKSKDLSEGTKRIFLETFSELPYKILWKLESAHVTTNSNILIKQWLPQQAILKHPNIKLFITQGGLQSLEEAIYNAVPIIAMPVYIDQYSNVRKVMRKGIGRTLDLDKLEKQILQENINEVVNNQKYKYAAEKLSALLREQPSGLEEAIRRAEYVMKYKGAKFLKQIDIPLYQYLLLDVFATFLLLVCILTCFLYVFVTLIVSFIKEKRKDKTKLE